jgi:UDP-N-acetylglucosamine 2-epimerase (non-hydrolysing)
MREVLNNIATLIQSTNILTKLSLQPKEYFLLSVHREENVNNEKNFLDIIDCINQIVQKYAKKIVISLHPRTRKIITQRNIYFDEKVILSEPFGLIDYCHLQKNALCVISDSGTLTEESTIFEFPAVLLRNSTEHPEGVDAGNIVIGNIDWKNLQGSLDFAIRKTQWNNIPCYDDTDVSQKICSIISGYVGIINKFIWMK